MHTNNKKWLRDLKKQYPSGFVRKSVLELGSGTTEKLLVKPLFEKCQYIGVDKVGKEGGNRGVDIVLEAKHTTFKKNQFDTLVCLSMFEHDPHWRQSFSHNLKWLKPGGYIFLCFGAEGNLHHGPEPWALVPYRKFLNFCTSLPIQILDAFFEEERYGYDGTPGVFDMVAKKITPLQIKKQSIHIRPVPTRKITLGMRVSQTVKFITTLSPIRFLKRIL